MRRPSLRLALAAAAALLAAAPLQAQVVAADGPEARGLIVRLKQPLANDRLLADGANPRSREAQQESVRWQRVLGEAGLSGASGRAAPRLRPVGRDQQLLEFERPLSQREAQGLRQKLLARPQVDWVEPNLRQQRLQVPPSDPLFAQQWWLQPVSGSDANALPARLRGVAGFQTAWLRDADAAAVVVAVLDTGITRHPDLQGRVLPGHDFVRDWDPLAGVGYANDGDGPDADPSDPGDWVSAADRSADPSRYAGCAVEDSSWHGTIIAGMIAAQANNGEGGAGVHWGASILPVRVAGKCGADLADIVDGMRWAAGLAVAGAPPNRNPARIVNISFGGSAACGAAYQAAVDELRAVGTVVVAAAGNEAGGPSRPASCHGVVGVVGLNRDGFKTHYSSFGGQIGVSGIATVSGDDADGAWGPVLADSGLVSLTNLGRTAPGAAGHARLYGTSFAAPQVAGTLALMLSLNPALSHEQLVQGLRASARPHVRSPKIAECSAANPGRCICTSATCGAGILDADRALVYASGLVLPPLVAPSIDNADLDAALRLAAQDDAVAVSPPPAGGGDGSGGGAFGSFWLLALATAVLTLRWLRAPLRR